MGLIEKTLPVGVDVVVDQMQRDLFIELTKRFGWKNYESYHRAYRNKKGDDLLPETYTGKNEYKEVLFDDRFNATSFFLVDETRTWDNITSQFKQGVSIIFQADLKKLLPDVLHRADEEMIDNIFKAIKRKGWESQLTEIITGVDRVYESLSISREKKHQDDMSNFAIARFNFEVLYINTNCTTQPTR